jgi:hypothetical protein
MPKSSKADKAASVSTRARIAEIFVDSREIIPPTGSEQDPSRRASMGLALSPCRNSQIFCESDVKNAMLHRILTKVAGIPQKSSKMN